MMLPRIGTPLRGIAAFCLTFLIVVLLATIGSVILGGRWAVSSLSTVAFVAFYSGILLSPVAAIVLVLTLPLRFTALSRPLSDIVIWSLTFVALCVVFWMPTLAGYADVTPDPITWEPLLATAAYGAVLGWVYWFLSGCPRRAN